jgi:hypothetical protein
VAAAKPPQKERETMVQSKFYLKQTAEPKVGSANIYYQKTENGCFDPVIVESGYFLDPQFGRVSNFWHWINLRTGKREHGYGCFLEMVEIREDAEND